MDTEKEVAELLATSPSRLKQLASSPKSYTHMALPKRRGGTRTISVPVAELARVQKRILARVLCRVRPAPCACGFIPGRSIVTGARAHVGHAVVVNLDIRDFFPSIRLPRVVQAYLELGHGDGAARLLALLCTERCVHGRNLPQGACTSPMLSNAVCRRLDQQLADLCTRSGFTYSRYADDLSFSGDEPARVGGMLHAVKQILRTEGFEPHPDKTRVMKRDQRQSVTGLTVNDRPNVSRRERRRLRAMLHNAARDGAEAPRQAQLTGKVAYVTMVDQVRAARWWAAVDALRGDGERPAFAPEEARPDLAWLDELLES